MDVEFIEVVFRRELVSGVVRKFWLFRKFGMG